LQTFKKPEKTFVSLLLITIYKKIIICYIFIVYLLYAEKGRREKK